MEIIIAIFVGFAIRSLIDYYIYKKKNPIGRLVIDHSDPDGAHLFMEIDAGKSGKIIPGACISLNVIEKDYIPRD